VRRPRGERAAKLEEVPAVAAVDELAARVRELVASGGDLSRVTAEVVESVPAEQRFATAGKVAELAAQLARPEIARQRPWVPVREDLVIEEWRIQAPAEER
jgi:hypothetical protein